MQIEHLRQSLRIVATSVVLGMSAAAVAHDGHKQDMTNAEMALMEAQGAEEMDRHTEVIHDANVENRPEVGPSSDRGPSAVTLTPEQAMENAIAENRVTSASDLLGRFHPVAAHFPIALLLTAALAELLLFLRPSLGLGPTIRFLVAGGTVGAILAAVLGWFAAGWRLADRSETLGLHRWNGTAIVGLALVASWLAFRPGNRWPLRTALVVIAAALVAQGYLGGEMVFGPNHLGI